MVDFTANFFGGDSRRDQPAGIKAMEDCDVQFGVAMLAGIPFEILPSDNSGGRRIVTNEYPFRDDHYNEVLGDKPQRWSLKGVFVGIGWRDKFTEAKAKWQVSGAVKFFEPTENRTYEVTIVDWSFSLDSKKLNYVEFTIELVEKGLEPYLTGDGNGDEIVAFGLKRYLDGVEKWWYPRFNLYRDIAKVFNAYDNVRGYLSNLNRQFMGIGSLIGVRTSIRAMNATRNQATNFNQAADVFEAVATNAGTDSAQAVAFHRAASEVRITGSIEEEDQANMAALIALGYYFEAIADNATPAELADFRVRAEAIKAAIDDQATTLLVDGLIASLGRAMTVPCRVAMTGQYNALALSYRLYGSVERAPEIIGLSGGVSGAAMNSVVYECQA